MADTSRTLAALQALLPDNTSGDVSPQDLRDFLLSVLSGYGTIYVQGASTAQGSITTTPGAKMTGFGGNGESSSDISADHTDDSLTVSVAGKYMVNCQLSFSGTASKTFHFKAHVDGAASLLGCSRKLGTGGDVGSCSFSGILDLAAAEVVTVYVYSSDGGTSMTLVDGQLTLTRVE